MSSESYVLKNLREKEVNDVYSDFGKIKFKKSNFFVLCIFVVLLFVGSILAVYFGVSLTSSTCKEQIANETRETIPTLPVTQTVTIPEEVKTTTLLMPTTSTSGKILLFPNLAFSLPYLLPKFVFLFSQKT